MEFREKLKEYKSIVNNELSKYLKKDNCPEKILNESIEYSLMAGGKRLRPILMINVYSMFKENIQECFCFACAMEMIHNFSLIHDDLPGIDNDDFRHGKLTNHKMYNEATAILAGDKLLNQAYILISNDILNSTDMQEQKKKIMAFNELSLAVDKMIAGEYIDTEYEGKDVAYEYLEYMHKNKTGALLVASARIGAILAGASDEDLENITKYSEIIGLTFQIQDDILSEIGDEQILGKPVGNDRKRGKCTYVTKYGLEKAKEMLEKLTNEAIEIVEKYKENGEFLKQLAIYIKERSK